MRCSPSRSREEWKRSCRSLQVMRHRCLPTGNRSPMNPSAKRSRCGRNIAAGRPRASGSRASPTAASPKCRARIPTTSTRCGPESASTSFRIATARQRSSPTTRKRKPCAKRFLALVWTSSPPRLDRMGSCMSSSAEFFSTTSSRANRSPSRFACRAISPSFGPNS